MVLRIGKSALVKYAGKRLALCSSEGITYREVVVDNSFQDEFHGRDVKNLKTKIEIEEPSPLGLLFSMTLTRLSITKCTRSFTA